MKITVRECMQGCVRHAAYAAMTLVGVCVLMEWAVPGSVLPFVSLYWVAVGACMLLVCSMPVASARMNRVLAFVVSCIVAGGVFLLLVDGRSVIPFTIASFLITLALLL